ncbi:hypothetical protein BgiBS90_008920 [Biomphalaria glabrata]|nr:hypothetical protein BgiBS90_008920 [Biomphalaria glabrata]
MFIGATMMLSEATHPRTDRFKLLCLTCHSVQSLFDSTGGFTRSKDQFSQFVFQNIFNIHNFTETAKLGKHYSETAFTATFFHITSDTLLDIEILIASVNTKLLLGINVQISYCYDLRESVTYLYLVPQSTLVSHAQALSQFEQVAGTRLSTVTFLVGIV